jgi:hypothetical protein
MPFLTKNHTSTPDSQVPQFFRDGLILPESVATQESPITILTMTASYMTLEEVIGQSITRSQIDFVLRQHDAEVILTNCALFLAVLQNERSSGRDDAQRQLAESSLRGDSRERALRLLDGGQRVFVSPQAVLGVMKVRLTMDDSRVTDSPVLVPEVATVMAILGLASELGNVNRDPQNEIGGLPETLAMEVFSNQLFNRRTYLAVELARHKKHRDLMFENSPEETAAYEDLFRTYTGTTVSTLFHMGILTLFRQLQDKVVSISPELFSSLDIEEDEVKAALDLLATDRATLSRLITKESKDVEFAWSFNTLRRYPMLRRDDGSLLILNPAFLLERVCGSAFFWEIKSRLIPLTRRSDEDGKEAKRLLGGFAGLIGRSAEDYVYDRLHHIEGSQGALGQRVWREAALQKLRGETPTPKGCDFVFDNGSDWIALDSVTSRVSQKAAEAGSRSDLDADINDIVFEKAEQLDSTIRWMIAQGGRLPGQSARAVTPTYFPVIVAYNGFPWNQAMAQHVYAELKSLGWLQHSLIHPLIVIDVRELEYLESATELGHSLSTILNNIVNEGVYMHPVNWYLSKNIGLKWPESLKTPLDQAVEELIAKYKPDFR